MKPVLQVRNKAPQVLYEQIIMLSAIADEDSNIPDSVVREFLNNPSWIVSRSAYLLVNCLEHDLLRHELINKYLGMKDEKEKLLILSAFEKQFNDAVAAFLFKEVLSTASAKIRYTIFSMLENCKNQETVLAWIDENYDRLIALEGEYLFQGHITTMEKKFSSRLLSIFLNKGFIADEEFLEELNENLENCNIKKDTSDSDKEKLNNLLAVESAVLTNKLLAKKWVDLKEKTRAFNAQLARFQNEFDVFSKEYTTKLDELFRKNNVPDEKRQKYIEDILSSRDNVKDLLVEDK